MFAAKASVKANMNTMRARKAIQRPCGTCNLIHNYLCGQDWWIQFGMKNPYIYTSK